MSFGSLRSVTLPGERVLRAIAAFRPVVGRSDLPPEVSYWLARSARALETEAEAIQAAVRVALDVFVEHGPGGEPVMLPPPRPGQAALPKLTDEGAAAAAQQAILRECSDVSVFVFDAARLLEARVSLPPAVWMDLDFLFTPIGDEPVDALPHP